MADRRDGRGISSFPMSLSPLRGDCPSDLVQVLSFNPTKKRFSWDGSVEDLTRFIEVEFANERDCDGGGMTKLRTISCAVFKLPTVTFNFYPNTKTLQIQGSACAGVRNHLEEVVSHCSRRIRRIVLKPFSLRTTAMSR